MCHVTRAGVPWRLHTWLQSVLRAHELSRDQTLLSLFTEFSSIPTEDYTPELVCSGVPLLFSILESTKVRTEGVFVGRCTKALPVFFFFFFSYLQQRHCAVFIAEVWAQVIMYLWENSFPSVKTGKKSIFMRHTAVFTKISHRHFFFVFLVFLLQMHQIHNVCIYCS